MKRISSKLTLLTKYFLPFAWFGGLGYILYASYIKDGFRSQLIIAISLLSAIGFYIFKITALNAVDEVYDEGNYIVVRNRGVEKRIRLNEITDVRYFFGIKQIRIKYAGEKEVCFYPNLDWSFHRAKRIKELLLRIQDQK